MNARLRAILEMPLVSYVAGLAAVGLMSVVIGLVLSYARVANLSMLYLVVVLAAAVNFGRGPAIFASVAAFLVYDWFFVEPMHVFTIGDPAEWVALLLFLMVAIITGQLAAALRRRAREAEQREREAVVLYDVVRLMSDPDFDRALRGVAERLHNELGLSAVSIKLTDNAGNAVEASFGEADALRIADARARAAVQVLGRGPAPSGHQRGAPGRWIKVMSPYTQAARGPAAGDRLQIVPVMAHNKRVGDLLLIRQPDAQRFTVADDRLLSAAATQVGLAVERVWLQREATEAEILRRTGELKTALLNAVSHDLRTPLASIIASAGSLRQHEVIWTEEERQEFAEAIEEEALRLNQIVGNLLDLSRIEGGSLRPDKGWYDLGALIDDVISRLKPLIEKRRIVVDIPDGLPPVLLDVVEIDQVLSNLIENAAKYTGLGTEIQVSARRSDAEVLVEVADRGPGIPASALPHLFDPFFRVAHKGPRPKGTGLGLAVARGLVEAHGGRIWAQNRRDGGASFIFALPLAPTSEKPLPEEQRQE